MKKNKLILILGLLAIGSFIRLVPHMPNVAPMVAITLFGAAVFKNSKLGLGLTFLFLYASDFIINNTIARPYFTQEGIIFFSNYMIWMTIAYIIIYLIGRNMKTLSNWTSTFGAALIASILFFLITNAGALFSPMAIYPKSFTGLMASYTAGLPFFRNSLLADLAFTGAIFGAYRMVSYYLQSREATHIAP